MRKGTCPTAMGRSTPDWSEIPPWRQTTFFGIRAPGRFFVYVIDCSESMIDEDRFARATMEVRRSVLSLQAPQQFEVIFYNEDSIPMPGGPKPRPADPQNKGQLVSWLRLIEPDGGTDPRTLSGRRSPPARGGLPALRRRLPRRDGRGRGAVQRPRIPIHCVDLSGGEGGDHLRRIARESGGQYASRPGIFRASGEDRSQRGASPHSRVPRTHGPFLWLDDDPPGCDQDQPSDGRTGSVPADRRGEEAVGQPRHPRRASRAQRRVPR